MPPRFKYNILPPLKKSDSQLQRDVVNLQRNTNISWRNIPEQHKYYWATGIGQVHGHHPDDMGAHLAPK